MRPEIQSIRTQSCPQCYLCGADGQVLYPNLADRLFSAPGTWEIRQCPDAKCGLLWLDPVPVEKDLALTYRDYYTHLETAGGKNWLRRAYDAVQQGYWAHRYNYRRAVAPWKSWLGLLAYLNPGRREEMDSAVMYLASQTGARLLEIGCGNGTRLKLLRTLGWNAEGIEVDPKAVSRCSQQGIPVRLGSLHDQRFASASFDAVVMNHVFEHVADPRLLLDEIRRVLAPAGTLVITTPNTASGAHRLFRRHWVALEPPRHLHLFNRRSLQKLVEDSGFLVRDARTTIRGAAWIFLASRQIERQGRFCMTETTPRPWRRWGRVMELFEWLRVKVDAEAGEQITLIAERL